MKLEYRFAYGSFVKFFFSQLFIAFYNGFTLLLIVLPIGLLYGYCEYIFKDFSSALKVITIVIFFLLFLFILFLFISYFLPKKAIITDNFILIKRRFLNYEYPFRGFNDRIFIKDVCECEIYDGERPLLFRSGPYSVFFFDWDSLVEIRLKNNKKYLVPIKNTDNFVDEVNKRMNNE